VRVSGVLLIALLSACGDSCSGCKGGSLSPEPGTPEPYAGKRSPSAATEPASTRKRDLGRYYKPRADGPELAQLKDAKLALEKTAPASDEPSAFDALAEGLPAALGSFDAAGEASEGPGKALGKSVRVARRIYKDGAQTAIVKITDARRAPALLQPIADRLDMEGLAATGNERGLMVQGKPGVESYFPEHKNSRLTVVDGARLIEIRVTGTDDPKAAHKVFDALTK